MDYYQLIQFLETPQATIFSPTARILDSVEEDPNWPTPQNYNDLYLLFRKLDQIAKLICALTAGQMVLPIWEDWIERHNSNIQQELKNVLSNYIINRPFRFASPLLQQSSIVEFPRLALKQVEDWIDGNISNVESGLATILFHLSEITSTDIYQLEPYIPLNTIDFSDPLFRRGNEPPANPYGWYINPTPHYALSSIGNVCYVASLLQRNPNDVIFAQAADAVADAGAAYGRLHVTNSLQLISRYKLFLKRWWIICQYRLATSHPEENFQWYRIH